MVAAADEVAGWRSRKLIIAGEIGNVILILVLYFHALLWLNTLSCEISEIHHASSHQHRSKRDTKQLPVDLEDYTIIIGQDTIIPRNVLDRSCSQVHQYCSEKSQRLTGFPGVRGSSGGRM